MKKIFFILIMLPFAAFAQKNFTIHKVQPKETLYSLSRQYNIHPRDLATFNNLDINTGLTIGQEVKIPTKPGSKPASQIPPPPPVNEKPATDNNSAVQYHTVQPKETLYAISKKYNVTIDELKQWNGLTGNGVSEGQRLKVGGAGNQENTLPAVAEAPKREVAPVQPVADDLEKQKAELARQKKQIEEQEKRLKEEEEKRQNAIAKAQEEEQKRKEAELKKQELNAQKAADKKTIEAIAEKKAQETKVPVKGDFGGGYFKDQYSPSKNKNEKGLAGVFKSTSGWDDGKYYCLHNEAPIGSIIKIINPANGKYVFAKVLDVIPDLKQNANLIVRMSNAAASELGQPESNFNCEVIY